MISKVDLLLGLKNHFRSYSSLGRRKGERKLATAIFRFQLKQGNKSVIIPLSSSFAALLNAENASICISPSSGGSDNGLDVEERGLDGGVVYMSSETPRLALELTDEFEVSALEFPRLLIKELLAEFRFGSGVGWDSLLRTDIDGLFRTRSQKCS